MDDVLFRWRTEGVRLNGRFSIDSQGHKNMQTTSQITSSLVEAKGGVVGGQVNLQKFNHTCMYYCYSPKHVIRIRHVYTSYSCSQLNDQTVLTTKGFPDNSTCRWPSSNGRPLEVIKLEAHRKQ